jgi:hypothetical protein
MSKKTKMTGKEIQKQVAKAKKTPPSTSATGLFKFYKDTKRFHAYNVSGSHGITGVIYTPRGEDVPDTITLKFEKKS